MKKHVKTALKYLCIGILLFVLVIFENSVPTAFVYFRISLVICVCLCVLKPDVASVATGALCGLFADFYSLSLPCFSFLYLYISSGCVWSVRLFVSVKAKTVFIICFFALFLFCAGEFLVDLLIFESFSAGGRSALLWLVFALINAVPSPIIYAGLKRAKY